jgi:hypothetical protein
LTVTFTPGIGRASSVDVTIPVTRPGVPCAVSAGAHAAPASDAIRAAFLSPFITGYLLVK